MLRTRTLTRPIVWLLAMALALGGAASAPASAADPGHIKGRVTGTDGSPLGGVTVAAEVFIGMESFGGAGSTQTAADGSYDLVVAPYGYGPIYLSFSDPSGIYAGEYYDNAYSIHRATTISVPDGTAVTGKDAELALSGHIAGTLSDPQGEPLAGAYVKARFADAGWCDWPCEEFYTKTADDGSYDLAGLPPAAYSLEFRAPGYRTTSYPAAVVVSSGATTTVRNARLQYSRQVTLNRRPAIAGTPKVGRKVTARPGSWSPARVKVTYRWLVAGRPVPGATHASFRPRAAQAGKRLRVRVTASAPGFASSTVRSAAKVVKPRR